MQSERHRIEQSGGCVLEFPAGCYRVNGRLAVSRAIGDYGLKDVVIGEPDIIAITLNGNEDFLIMACDGLWDYAQEDEVATRVYTSLEKNNGESFFSSLSSSSSFYSFRYQFGNNAIN